MIGGCTGDVRHLFLRRKGLTLKANQVKLPVAESVDQSGQIDKQNQQHVNEAD